MPTESRVQVYESGDCEVDLARRELRAGGIAMPIGGRAFEIIETLVRSAGEIVTKDDLMDRVWRGAVVEENTLQVHISAVRKALGPYRGMLKTESRRGYRLLGSWAVRQESPAPEARPLSPLQVPAQPSLTNFPATSVGLIGRSADTQQLQDLLSAYRAVTLTGPGGIGKTKLALEVARYLLADFDNDGCLVELATLSDPSLVPSAVAGVLGLRLGGNAISSEAVARAIGARKLLLVLDNCEHVIDAAAQLAETVVRLCPDTTVLATSREVLRIDGEYVYRVPPLKVPPQDQDEPEHLLGHSAVELFIARARAHDADFAPQGGNLSAIAAICRHLDGIPLAIEFAAARAATLGIQQVAMGLEDRFSLLTSGRRTALPRHQTLRAALDWSYELLPPSEQRSLRHLAVFAGGFTSEAAAAVTSSSGIATGLIVENIANLVAKSLIVFDGSVSPTRWRMLETIRAYALEKLADDSESEAAARRHAEYHRDLFSRARGDWESQPTSAWLAEYGHRLDDLRVALDWAYSSSDTVTLATALTIDAVPLWLQLSLMRECRQRVEQALSHIGSETGENARLRMRLYTALSLSRMYTGEPLSEIHAGWSKTRDLAEQLGDADYQLRAIWGLFAVSFNRAHFRGALELAERFREVATDTANRLIGERLIGTALHILGDQKNARRDIEHMLAGYTAPATSSHIIRFQNDQLIAARRVLAPILWLQGYGDQAMRMVEDAVTDALGIDHTLTLCNLLGQAACPLALLAGDLAAAHRYTTLLIEHATRHSLDVWHAYGRGFEGMLLIRQNDFERGLARLRAAGDDLRQAGFMQYYTPFLGALAEALGAAQQPAAGLAAIEEALAQAESTEEHWCLAELLRVEGELRHQLAGRQSIPAAESCFNRAIELARGQGALAWELRGALSLARLRVTQNRHPEARQILAPVYDRFTEGFETADLRAARALLESLPTGTLT